MNTKLATIGLLAATALATAPISPASAHGFRHGGHGDGLLFGLLGAGAAVGIAAATIATAPVRILADAATPEPAPAYYPAPAPAPAYYTAPPQAYYAAPAPVAYAPYGYAYAAPRRVVYSYPQPVYGYPAYQ